MHLTGISIMPRPDAAAEADRYFAKCKEFYGEELKAEIKTEDWDIRTDYDCGAYNNPVKEVRDAIYYMAEKI